jgi:serine/threonine-protein kinase
MTQGSIGQRLRPFKPTQLGRYTLVLPISTSGLAEVFLAVNRQALGSERICALKKVGSQLSAEPEFVRRFFAESRVLADLSHHNIAKILDFGTIGDAVFVAVEYVDGKDLKRLLARLKGRRLTVPLPFVLYVMTKVLDALSSASSSGFIHGDVSPQNILVSYGGEVKVIDFGVARSAVASSKAHAGALLSRQMNASPEQRRGQPADHRSDVYGVGLCLYELVSGKHPLDGTLGQMKPLQLVEPRCSVVLSNFIEKAVSPEPEHRFETIEEMRGAFARIAAESGGHFDAEAAALFMKEAFGTEYANERKLLVGMAEPITTLDDVGPEVQPPDSTNDLTPIPVVDPQAVTAETAVLAPLSFRPTRKTTESLSFLPTRRRAGASDTSSSSPTMIVAPDSPEASDLTSEASTGLSLAPQEKSSDTVLVDPASLIPGGEDGAAFRPTRAVKLEIDPSFRADSHHGRPNLDTWQDSRHRIARKHHRGRDFDG